MILKRLVKSILLAGVLLPGVARSQGEPVPTGDPGEGRALFVGSRPLLKGGPPCGACHGIGGQGPGLRANYGPDLSETHATLGDEALDAILVDLPFPSMTPVYDGRALEPAERAHLTAYLRAAGGQAPARDTAAFAIHGGLGATLVLAGLFLAGRRRLRSVREQLLSRHGGSR
jgi:mono/diheme cytochrome c family protein